MKPPGAELSRNGGTGWKPTSLTSRIALRQSVSNPRQARGKIAIPHRQRREAPLGDKRMVEREHDGLLVDDVKRMAELAGIAHAGQARSRRRIRVAGWTGAWHRLRPHGSGGR
jgi:hypothetical protein